MSLLPKSLQTALNTRNGRIFQENLTAYFLIFPATAIIFIFGIFPVAFAFLVSLYNWRRFPGDYLGLGNYERALGNFGYVLFFWLSLGLFIYVGVLLYRTWRDSEDDRRAWGFLLPGLVNAVAATLFVDWFFKLVLGVLEIPQRLPRNELRDRGKFISEFFNSFTLPDVRDAAYLMLIALAVGLVLSVAAYRILKQERPLFYLFRMTIIPLAVIAGVLLIRLTVSEIDTAIQDAQESGDELPVWSQIIFISLGAACLALAYWFWQKAVHAESDRRFGFGVAVALLLLISAYMLVTQVPQALSEADDDLLEGFWVTILYVTGTVPVQLSMGLGLAYLLFYAARGKTVFRIVYFLPYITPFAATAVVFSTLFSNRDLSPANRFLNFFGIPSQTWLLQPRPVMELIFGTDLPKIIEGPGLALLVIIIWTTWTYIGYDIVIFMAGLGNISPEYYEAAQIDGASGWRIFRHITLPLLSPTTFFLSLIAIIGTFQAFTQIWIMRRPASTGAVDTVGVYLFETISSADPRYGFGSAMAFVLFGVILIVTLLQNRIMGRRVFYG